MPDESKKVDAEILWDLFSDIHKIKNNGDKMEELVEQLVDKETLDSCHYGEYHYQTFCKAYVIKLFNECIRDSKDRQLMLASYGLLDGYRGLPVGKRYKKYAKEAGEFDARIDPDWSDPSKSIKNIEEPTSDKWSGIKGKLIKEIIKLAGNDKEITSRLAKEVDEELSQKFPDGLPKELPLEKPLYLSMGKSVGTIIGTEIGGVDDGIKDVADDKKPGSKIRRLRITIAILILVVIFLIIGFVIYMKFNDTSKQDKNGNYEPVLTENGTFQSDAPVSIHYNDGVSVELSVPATVSRDENGVIAVTNINTELDKGNGNDENNNLKGVNDHEEKQ